MTKCLSIIIPGLALFLPVGVIPTGAAMNQQKQYDITAVLWG